MEHAYGHSYGFPTEGGELRVGLCRDGRKNMQSHGDIYHSYNSDSLMLPSTGLLPKSAA